MVLNTIGAYWTLVKGEFPLNNSHRPENYIAVNRDAIRRLDNKMSPRISGAAGVVFLRMLILANHTPGFLEGKFLERGDVNVSLSTLQRLTGHSQKTVRNAIGSLVGHNEIVKKGANEGAGGSIVYEIKNYDTYNVFENEGASEGARWGQGGGKVGATSKDLKDLKEVDQNLKTMSETEGVSDVSISGEELFPVSDNGKTKTVDIGAIAAHYNAKIHDKARLIDKARDKIRVRLNTYAKEDLIRAMDNFSADPWWMENNSRHGMAWFFRSDEHIERFLNLIPRKAAASNPLLCPEHGPMERSNVNGNIVYFCKQFRNGCPNVYRSEVVWTDKLQAWEMGNRV